MSSSVLRTIRPGMRVLRRAEEEPSIVSLGDALHSSCSLPPCMPKGKPISEDLRWAIVRMHALGVKISTICTYTDVSRRQVYRILNRFRTTGKVLTATQRKKTGRARHLSSDDVAVHPLILPSYCTVTFLVLSSICRAVWI
ncbi:hypothetical protein C8R44DRAFT_803734 [Mycena epipterygia]|nr:hypothetical protein C8R44DRAFT_803734 [Mycena epipterygia]